MKRDCPYTFKEPGAPLPGTRPMTAQQLAQCISLLTSSASTIKTAQVRIVNEEPALLMRQQWALAHANMLINVSKSLLTLLPKSEIKKLSEAAQQQAAGPNGVGKSVAVTDPPAPAPETLTPKELTVAETPQDTPSEDSDAEEEPDSAPRRVPTLGE